MYGTIFRLHAKSGRENEIAELFNEWSRQYADQVKGARAAYLLQTDRDSGDMIAVAVFDDEESYRANASRPEQDAWYRRLRDALESDPEWEDGVYLVAETR